MIAPKIIHQIWMQGWDKIPEKFRSNSERIEKHNPEFQIMRWDEKSLQNECQKLGKEYLDKFNELPHMIMKVDFGRYVVLYNHGGISVDTDMYSLNPILSLSELKNHNFIISNSAFPSNMFNYVNNALIIVTPHNPIMKEILLGILKSKNKEKDHISKETYINNTTGPTYINSIVKSHDSVYILDNKYFEPCMSSDPVCKPSKETIMDHQHELSWMNPYLKFLSKVFYILLYIWWIPALIIAGLYFKKDIFKIYKSYITSKRR
jgi:mannosyltransferase OCH1-like enzyme